MPAKKNTKLFSNPYPPFSPTRLKLIPTVSDTAGTSLQKPSPEVVV